MNQPDYDPFADQHSNYARPRRNEALEKGKCYEIIQVMKKLSDFKNAKTGHCPHKTIVQYVDAGLKFQTILPKSFNDKSDHWIEAMNKLIQNNINPKLVCVL